jgi:regulator of protease activity HflC (stomatin/prohibitin superfamily)
MSVLAMFVVAAAAALFAVLILFPSIRVIGPSEVGLVMKRIGAKLPGDNPIAIHGEAGYQAELLMPGVRFKLWLRYRVEKFPWVQVPANEIGVVIAQVGQTLPPGAKSARYKDTFGNFVDLETFIANGGEKGVQRPVLAPGTLLPMHPVAFLVITKDKVFGLPISPDLHKRAEGGRLTPSSFNLQPEGLNVVRIEPRQQTDDGEKLDVVGVVTTLEGKPLTSGHIASRLRGFTDIELLERENADNAKLIEALLGDKNELHNNYQNFQAFLDAGGEMGLQHDVLRYGAYNLNPFLVRVEIVPMLVVRQGETATIKAYVGLSAQDTSGVEFKFGSLVRPGHRGLWEEPLRTGKYAINPRIYQAEIVPTAIIKLDWAAEVTGAHGLDAKLQPIIAKSKEGFVFKIDLQVLIHVPDTKAPKVISMVGTMQNLVNEVLQAAVGNLFRDKLGSMQAITFIETRQTVQEEAFKHIKAQLEQYEVETRGVYIQDVILPPDLVQVLTQREIANQEVKTFEMQKMAQDKRIDMEKSKGTAEVQAELARSEVGITIKSNNANARKAEADGEAEFISKTGAAKAAEVKAVGLANAEAYQKQVDALGQGPTALVNAISALSKSSVPFMPNILVAGGNGHVGAFEGLAGTLMGLFSKSSAPADDSTANGS